MTAPAPRNHPAEDAHPAPTPAPVAVPEDDDLDNLVQVIRDAARGGCGSHQGCRDLVLKKQRDAARRWLVDHCAPRENARPEPVVASSEADRVLGNIAAAHVEYGVLRAANPDDPALPPVVAPLPSEAVEVTEDAVSAAREAYWPAYSEAVRNAPSNRNGQGISSEDGANAGRAGMRAALAAALDHLTEELTR